MEPLKVAPNQSPLDAFIEHGLKDGSVTNLDGDPFLEEDYIPHQDGVIGACLYKERQRLIVGHYVRDRIQRVVLMPEDGLPIVEITAEEAFGPTYCEIYRKDPNA